MVCGTAWLGMGIIWYGMVWYGMVWHSMAWHGIFIRIYNEVFMHNLSKWDMVWYGGMVEVCEGAPIGTYGMVWYGMVWYGRGL